MSKLIKIILSLVFIGLFMRYGFPVYEFLLEETKVTNGMVLMFIFWLINVYVCNKKIDSVTNYAKELEIKLLKSRGDISCNRRGLNEVSRRLMRLEDEKRR